MTPTQRGWTASAGTTAVLLLFSIGCEQAKASAGPSHPPAVSVATVALREINPAVELQGRVEAIQEIEVRPRVSGHITALSYLEGAEVRKDALLFTIDPRPYQAIFARAGSELARARSRSDQAKREFARSEQLLAAGAASRVERDNAESTVGQTGAEVQAALAALESARLDLQFTQVRAAVDGRVGRALVSIGDFVTTGPVPTLLTTLVSVDPVYVYFTADEPTFLKFASRSAQARVAIGLADESGFPHAGKLDFVDNHLDASTGTIQLRARLDNRDRRLTPGLYARVQLQENRTRRAIVIDDKAVLTDQDRRYVLLLNATNTVERHDVQLGPIVDGLRVVDKGLQVGDRVIVNGTQKVLPGIKATVALADGNPAKAAGEERP